ncbi:MAG: hypothetical protein NVV73_15145 [Cellvibrionaceae bacterium]|nr:hypothetical protein [Cellvibrionaceae bacterium]
MSIGDGIAFLALIIAFVSLYRTRKQTELENQMNVAISKLNELQLKALEREEDAKQSADIGAYFYLDGSGNYRLSVVNMGQASATNVGFKMKCKGQDTMPFPNGELASKFPKSKLKPGDQVYLLTDIHLGMPSEFIATSSWQNPSGELKTKKFEVSLPE